MAGDSISGALRDTVTEVNQGLRERAGPLGRGEIGAGSPFVQLDSAQQHEEQRRHAQQPGTALSGDEGDDGQHQHRDVEEAEGDRLHRVGGAHSVQQPGGIQHHRQHVEEVIFLLHRAQGGHHRGQEEPPHDQAQKGDPGVSIDLPKEL